MNDQKTDRTILFFIAALLLPVVFIIGGLGLSFYSQSAVAPPKNKFVIAYADRYRQVEVRISSEGWAEARDDAPPYNPMHTNIYFAIIDATKGIEEVIVADTPSKDMSKQYNQELVPKVYYTAQEMQKYVLQKESPEGYIYEKNLHRGGGILNIFNSDSHQRRGPYLKKGAKIIDLGEWLNEEGGRMPYPEFVGWVTGEK